MSRAQTMTHRAFRDAKVDKSKMETIWGALQMSYHAEVRPTGGRELCSPKSD